MIIESYNLLAFAKSCLKPVAGVVGLQPTRIEGLHQIVAEGASSITNLHVRPSLWLVLEGVVSVGSGSKTVRASAGEVILVAQDLYVTLEIEETPFLAVALSLDVASLRRLQNMTEPRMMDRLASDALYSGPVDRDIAEAVRRLLECVRNPERRPVMVPLIREELHYLALMTEIGSTLRNLTREDSHASRISKVLAYINTYWNRTLEMAELAGHAEMGASSFHAHFKSMTGTSPLQYQKSRRMHEACLMLRETSLSVGEICHRIGYESPTQFSRDYRKVYGHPPIAERNQQSGQ